MTTKTNRVTIKSLQQEVERLKDINERITVSRKIENDHYKLRLAEISEELYNWHETHEEDERRIKSLNRLNKRLMSLCVLEPIVFGIISLIIILIKNYYG